MEAQPSGARQPAAGCPAGVSAERRREATMGGMQVDELRQARALAEENGRLKRIVADLTVQIDILKAINAKKW